MKNREKSRFFDQKRLENPRKSWQNHVQSLEMHGFSGGAKGRELLRFGGCGRAGAARVAGGRETALGGEKRVAQG